MQGLWIDGKRPASKKEVDDAAKEDPSRIVVEATSAFGNEYDGPATDLPESDYVYFVGPDPHTQRDFYGTLYRSGDQVLVR